MISIGNSIIDFGHFPDGTTLVKYANENSSAFITWKYENNEEIINLYYLVRHLQSNGVFDIILNMPYLPNARQDRVKNPEDIFTLKYFCELINSLGLRGVMTRDVHSAVAEALLENHVDLSVQKYIEVCMELCELEIGHDIMFYPDEGAMKRYSNQIDFPYAFGIKNRDWSTGKITGLDIGGTIPKEPFDVLFVDDIISYGGSLYHSAKKLKELGANKIYAFITHVENSILKGDVINSGLVERYYTTDSIFTKKHDLIQVL